MTDSRDRSRKISLVITVALADEIPLDWLRSHSVLVLTGNELERGVLGSHDSVAKNGGVLLVITGVGAKRARRAAKTIIRLINPLYLVNIGTAGALSDNDNLVGSWVIPQRVADEEGALHKIDTRLPFPTGDFEPTIGGRLLTVKKPVFDKKPESWTGVDFVDMEAAAYIPICRDAGVSFHLLKRITDDSGIDGVEQWRSALGNVRDEMRSILKWVEGAGEPDISVVIPVYDRAELIADCVASVLAQTLKPRQIIVVDDGSTDDTPQILKTFGDAITLVTLPQNGGVSAARNEGVKNASGSWVAFLDSDDRWRPDKLASQWRYITQNRWYQIVQGEEVWIRNGIRVNPKQKHQKPEGWLFEPSLQLCLVSPSSVMMRHSFLVANGGFDESLPACEDYDLWLRMGRFYPVGLDRAATTQKYGGHDDQLSRKYRAMDRFRVVALQKILAKENNPDYRTMIAKILLKKLNVLLGGSRKRNLHNETSHYESMLVELQQL